MKTVKYIEDAIAFLSFQLCIITGVKHYRTNLTLLIEKAVFVTSLLYISREIGTLGGLLGFFYQKYKNIGNLTLAEE